VNVLKQKKRKNEGEVIEETRRKTVLGVLKEKM
jgi:hypothetical protein